VAYDISDGRRLRRVHKAMKGYGESWQYSVFFCVLRDIDRVRMERDLKDLINQQEDQVVILALGSDEESAREAASTLGRRLPVFECGGSVVVV
jgi:CRISPR-associated protein Cas2